MLFVAEEVRTIIAALGSLEDQGCSKWETEEGQELPSLNAPTAGELRCRFRC